MNIRDPRQGGGVAAPLTERIITGGVSDSPLSLKWESMSREEREAVERDELGIEPRRLSRRTSVLLIGALSLVLWCVICFLAWVLFS